DILDRLFSVKTVSDLQKLSIDKYELEELEIFLRFFKNLRQFLEKLEGGLLTEYREVCKQLKQRKDEEQLSEIQELMNKAWEELDNKQVVLDLKEKLDKYTTL
ncbi:MAG: hypothetical protein ACOCZ3_03690, partial [Bacillota bacterium]